MTDYKIYPIGKFKVDGEGTFIEVDERYIPALKALDGFSHINVIWWFSDADNEEARATLQVEQPYKGAPQIMGTFATRSPLRPNPIALTASEIIHIDYEKGVIQITFTDADPGTPVLDIKPYTPSFDRIQSPGVPSWCSHWPKSSEESASFAWEDIFMF